MTELGTSTALVEPGEDVLADANRELLRGGRIVHLQLLASQFYERVRAELAGISPSDAEALSMLTAVADQCCRVVTHSSSPHLILAEFRAAVAMLTPLASPPPPTVARGTPVLRLIQGGRA